MCIRDRYGAKNGSSSSCFQLKEYYEKGILFERNQRKAKFLSLIHIFENYVARDVLELVALIAVFVSGLGNVEPDVYKRQVWQDTDQDDNLG